MNNSFFYYKYIKYRHKYNEIKNIINTKYNITSEKSYIDIYNFKLINYTPHNKKNQFGDFIPSDKDTIGTLSTISDKYTDIMRLSYIYSIDYINSINKFNNKYYKFYKNRLAKGRAIQPYTNEYKIFITKNIDNVLEKLSIELKNKLTDIDINSFTNDNGYIKKIIISPDTKVIIFGDHHGSFHTFFRNMIRLHIMGVLDLPSYKINKGYVLIFLGDIVDRGMYSMEILDIIFQFIVNSTDSIHINRGNHEDIKIFKRYGFNKELNGKFGADQNNMNDEYYNKITKIFSYCSTAIILLVKDNNIYTHKFWLCHGMIPSDKAVHSVYGNTIDFIDIIDKFINSSDYIFMLDDKAKNNTSLIAHEIKWNDTLHDNDIILPDDEKSFLTGRKSIGMNTMNRYLKYFNFIIRGHEDKYANAWILNKKTNKYIIGKDYNTLPIERFKFHKNSLLYDINNKEYPIYRVNDINIIDGPVQSISTTLQKPEEDSINVLTIATNTDYNRPLTCDSFIVMRFNNDMIISSLESRNKNNIDILNWMKRNESMKIYDID